MLFNQQYPETMYRSRTVADTNVTEVGIVRPVNRKACVPRGFGKAYTVIANLGKGIPLDNTKHFKIQKSDTP